jgi:broad specificity phosphatase PhoE
MDGHQKAALDNVIEEAESIILSYKEEEELDESYEYCAVLNRAIDLLDAFTNNIEAREANKLLSECANLINAMMERDYSCYAGKEVTEAIKPFKRVREQAAKLKKRLNL